MRQTAKEIALYDDLQSVVRRHHCENGLSVAQVCGILAILNKELMDEARDFGEEEEDESDPEDLEGEEWKQA